MNSLIVAQEMADQLTADRATTFFESFNENMNKDGLDRWMENWAEEAQRYTPMVNASGRAEIRQLYEDLQARYSDMQDIARQIEQ